MLCTKKNIILLVQVCYVGTKITTTLFLDKISPDPPNPILKLGIQKVKVGGARATTLL